MTFRSWIFIYIYIYIEDCESAKAWAGDGEMRGKELNDA